MNRWTTVCRSLETKAAADEPLSDAERAHADGCERCRDTLAFAERFARATRSLSAAEPGASADEVRALTEAVLATAPHVRRAAGRRWALAGAAAAPALGPGALWVMVAPPAFL